MGIFEEMENDFKNFCDTSKKFIADYKKNQKELELLRKQNDLLQEENLDYRYDITDIACEKATEMARDWEEQYKYELAVLEKALDIAILELDFARNHSQSTSVECVERIEKLKESILTKAKEMMKSE